MQYIQGHEAYYITIVIGKNKSAIARDVVSGYLDIQAILAIHYPATKKVEVSKYPSIQVSMISKYPCIQVSGYIKNWDIQLSMYPNIG